jgi:hypothetical protein
VSAISPELVSAAFGGLALLVGALATYTANRSRRVSEDQRLRKQQLRQYRDRYEAALAYSWRLREELAERGIPIPARPRILEDDDGDDVPAVAPRPPVPDAGQPDVG